MKMDYALRSPFRGRHLGQTARRTATLVAHVRKTIRGADDRCLSDEAIASSALPALMASAIPEKARQGEKAVAISARTASSAYSGGFSTDP